ncbi:MAG: hypothetical protein ACK4K7_15260 [Allosphingosinicella sp.]|uniref:hypothetical protein n=1 Tax=Allosphingosinicella sp. TaxID=2823234 RepID=UPI003922041A
MFPLAARAAAVPQAALCSGPIFVFATFLAELYLRLPHPVALPPIGVVPPAILSSLLMLGFSAIVSAIVALIPVLVGATAMMGLSARFQPARLPLAWALAGAACGAAIAWALDAGPSISFGIFAASSGSAWIVRLRLWNAELEAELFGR